MRHRVILSLLILLLVACDVRGVDPVVKIGLVAPFEGEQRQIGYDVIYSTRLAVRQINEQGGIDGYRVSLVAYDDSSYAQEARSVAQALIVDPDVVAVIGHWQPQTTAAAAEIYTAAAMPLIPMGSENFGAYDPALVPAEWRDAYQQITFQQSQPPGLFAVTAYDAMQLIFAAIDEAADSGRVTRETVGAALQRVEIDGLTGELSLP